MKSRRRPPGQFARKASGRPYPAGRSTRALPQVYLSKEKNVVPGIYLPEMTAGKPSARLKWLVSTCIAGVVGLAAIAVTIYVAKDDAPGQASLTERFKQYGAAALKRLDNKLSYAPGFSLARGKSDRITMTSRGLITSHIIHDRVVQRRGNRQFIAIQPYTRLVVSFATQEPEDTAAIPPFNPFKLYASLSADKNSPGQGAETGGKDNVKVKVIELLGGILPAEDGQELPAEEVEKLVAAAGEELVAENGSDQTTADDVSADSADDDYDPLWEEMNKETPVNTTIIEKTLEQENDAGEITEVKTLKIGRGDRLYDILLRNGSETWQARAIIAAMNKIYPANNIKVGQRLRLLLTPSLKESGKFEPVQLSLYEGRTHKVTVVRSASGDYVSSDSPLAGTIPDVGSGNKYRTRATTYTSLYHAGLVQGLSHEMIMKILRIHAYDTDFKRLVRQGDGFEAFFDMKQKPGGEAEPGELLFTAINIDGETRRFYRFRSPDGHVDYYDANGDSAKKFLMRKPVRSHDVRFTSGFGYRMHPVLKQRKMHKGVDWAARRGTPILAAGNGVVEFAGRRGGYGNYVRIRHANGYKTAYAHMHRIAPGIHKGAKVRQGQVIGSVGSSGRSTGNHLHFEVLVNNRHVNPMTIHVPRGRQLRGKLLAAFKKERDRIDDLMQRAPVNTRVATVDDIKRVGKTAAASLVKPGRASAQTLLPLPASQTR